MASRAEEEKKRLELEAAKAARRRLRKQGQQTGKTAGGTAGQAVGTGVGAGVGAAGGAVSGAIAGAAAGGVGAIPGAAAGARAGAKTGAKTGGTVGRQTGRAVGGAAGRTAGDRVGAGLENKKKSELEQAKNQRAAGKRSGGEPPAREDKDRSGLSRFLLGKQGVGGTLFWIALIIAIVVDILDLLSLTGVGAVVTLITGIIGNVLILIYLLASGVSLQVQRMAARVSVRLGIWIVSLIVELIPWVELIPSLTLSLLVVRAMENSQIAKRVVSVVDSRSKT